MYISGCYVFLLIVTAASFRLWPIFQSKYYHMELLSAVTRSPDRFLLNFAAGLYIVWESLRHNENGVPVHRRCKRCFCCCLTIAYWTSDGEERLFCFSSAVFSLMSSYILYNGSNAFPSRTKVAPIIASAFRFPWLMSCMTVYCEMQKNTMVKVDISIKTTGSIRCTATKLKKWDNTSSEAVNYHQRPAQKTRRKCWCLKR